MEQFRKLRHYERTERETHHVAGEFLVDNFRKPMPLNDRNITASFEFD